MRTLVRLWVMLACCLSMQAQEPPLSRAELDSLVRPPLAAEGLRMLRFGACSVDVGRVQDTLTVSFPFRSVAQTDTVRIVSVRSLCPCLQAVHVPRTVLPGAADSITLRYLPPSRQGGGRFRRRAYVYTTAAAAPVACLEVRGGN